MLCQFSKHILFSLQDELQNTVGGGKPKMKHHFNKFGWPASSKAGPAPSAEDAKDLLVDDLQVRIANCQ